MLVSPCEVAVIQRGIKFSVDFPTQGNGSEAKDAENAEADADAGDQMCVQ
jgi:homogentisate 1,2-dioxygenase